MGRIAALFGALFAIGAALDLGCGGHSNAALRDSGAASRDSGAASRDSGAASRPVDGVPRYLAIGDSFTIGTGSAATDAFPARLVAHWRTGRCVVELRNVARNGVTSAEIIAEQLPSLEVWRPTFVSIAVGANDIVQGTTPEQYQTNVRRILGDARRSGARIIVLPQPDWSRSPVAASFGDPATLGSSIQRFNAILADEARTIGATWMDLAALMERQAATSMFAADGLHPSAAAYAGWAEAMERVAPSPCS